MPIGSPNNESTPLLIIKAQPTFTGESTLRLNQVIDSFLLQPELAKRLSQKNNHRIRKIFSITLILNLLILGGLITACYFIFKNIAEQYPKIDSQLDTLRELNSTVLVNVNSSHDPGLTQSSIKQFLQDRVNAWEDRYEHTFTVPNESNQALLSCSELFDGLGFYGKGLGILEMVEIGSHDHDEKLRKGACWQDLSYQYRPHTYWDDCRNIVRNFCNEINLFQPYRNIDDLLEKIKADYVGFGFILLVMSLLTAGQILLMCCIIKRSKPNLSLECGLTDDNIKNLNALCETLNIEKDERTNQFELGIKLLIKKIHIAINKFLHNVDISNIELETIFISINRLLAITKNGVLFNQSKLALNTFFEFAFELQKMCRSETTAKIFNALLKEKSIVEDERFDVVFRYRIFEYIYEYKISQSVKPAQAFRFCLPLCMLNGKLLICSNDDLQLMFDGYLQEATGKPKITNSEVLSHTERNKLLFALIHHKVFIALSIFMKDNMAKINNNGEQNAKRLAN